MTQEYAKKRIHNAIEKFIKEFKVNATEQGKKDMFTFILSDFNDFEANEIEYTSTQNLNFAIAIHLNDEIKYAFEILEERN